MKTNLLVGFTVSPLELLKDDYERKGEKSCNVFHRNGNKQTLTFKKKTHTFKILNRAKSSNYNKQG